MRGKKAPNFQEQISLACTCDFSLFWLAYFYKFLSLQEISEKQKREKQYNDTFNVLSCLFIPFSHSLACEGS
jgi:hypothetical protein